MKKKIKLNDNGSGVLRPNLPKVFTDYLGWDKNTRVEIELKGKKLILKEVKDEKMFNV